MSDRKFIERRIITGFITSDDFIRQMYPIYKSRLLSSSTAKLLAGWCIEYFEQYNCAPGQDIEGIFNARMKHLSEDKVQDIEEILEGLSDEYEQKQFNVPYLLDQTRQHFQEKHLQLFADEVKATIDEGKLTEAERLASGYVTIAKEDLSSIDPFKDRDRIKQAFEASPKPLITFPRALGQFWNSQLTRDSFVAFLGPEKRGKTWMLMELAIRGLKSGCNVVFFQAGDMSEAQQIRRICIHLAKRSDKERYCQGMYIPVVDCIYNQTDSCDKEERECGFGLFEAVRDLRGKNRPTFDELVKAYKENPEYNQCRNCTKIKGTPWLKWQESTKPLTWQDAYRAALKFRKKHKKQFKLVTYPNETLSVLEIRSLLDTWEKQENFIPDVIVIDYADILDSDPDCKRLQPRDMYNKIWQRLRRLSQERHCLVITATQAAASSYGQDTLKQSDFSEDKRKYAHVTAMYGLNQTDEEKRIGVMRLNELVVREDEFDGSRQLRILQKLQMGRPFLGSYW